MGQKNKTLVEEFAVPNDAERDSFLETADEQEIYSARELVFEAFPYLVRKEILKHCCRKLQVPSAAIKRDRGRCN